VPYTNIRVRQRPRLLTHLAYPYSHPRKARGNRTAAGWSKRDCRRPRPSSTTASVYVSGRTGTCASSMVPSF